MVVEFPVQNDEYNYHDSLQAHLKAGEKGIMGPLHDPTTFTLFTRRILTIQFSFAYLSTGKRWKVIPNLPFDLLFDHKSTLQ